MRTILAHLLTLLTHIWGRFLYNRKIQLLIIRKKANYGRYAELGKCFFRKFRLFSVLRHFSYHTEKVSSILTAHLPAELPLTLYRNIMSYSNK